MAIFSKFFNPWDGFKALADALEHDPLATLEPTLDYYDKKPVWILKNHVGRVVDLSTIGWHDDCDYLAKVYIPSEDKFINIMYDTTRFGGGGSASIDATPEIMEKHNAILRAAEEARLEAARKAEESTIRNGKWVRVVRGRKTPIGTEGIVFWIGVDNYNNTKLGISPSGMRGENKKFNDAIFVYAKNCEVNQERTKNYYDETTT